MTRRGELRRIHRGVYLVGPSVSVHARAQAAILACGPGTAISHHSAAYLYGLLPYPARPVPVDVTVAGRRIAGDRRIRVHHTARLASYEVRSRANIPVTAPIRTLVDLSATATADELEQAIAEAFALRLAGRSQILRELDRSPPRPGTAALRLILDAGAPQRTRSRPERRLLTLIRDSRLPEPEANARVGGWEVDLLVLQDLGHVVLRVSARTVDDDPEGTVSWIEREHARRRGRLTD